MGVANSDYWVERGLNKKKKDKSMRNSPLSTEVG